MFGTFIKENDMPTFKYEIVFPDPAPPEATHKVINWMIQGQPMIHTSSNVPVNQPIYVEITMPILDHTPITVVGRWVKEMPRQDGMSDFYFSENSNEFVFNAVQIPASPSTLRLGNVLRIDA
jgi:hypothetical protein